MHEALIRLGLVDEDEIILDEAALALASLDHPETKLDRYYRLLHAVAECLSSAGIEAVDAHDQAIALSRVLTGEFGLLGDTDTYDNPENADLIRVLERRRGLPVSLSILYVAAARRLGWTANVLGVPGHVLVLVGEAVSPVIIDPFQGGAIVQSEQLAALLTGTDDGPQAVVRHIATMPNRAILVRLLANQATRAEEAGKGRRALELYGRMTLIAPGDGHAWWQRARLEQVDGDVPAARRSLTSMLEITREPRLRRIVSEALEKLGAP